MAEARTMLLALVICRGVSAGVAVPQPPLPPPPDAVVLFDGASTEAFTTPDGAPVAWKIVDGTLEIVPGTGDLVTKQELGFGQYHVEYRRPKDGRSMLKMLGSLALPIGLEPAVDSWETLDVMCLADVPEDGDRPAVPAKCSFVVNGLWSVWGEPLPARFAFGAAPLRIEDSGSAVRFRNLWYRPLDSKRSEHEPVLAPPPADAEVLLGKDGPVGLNGGGNRPFGWTIDDAEIEVREGGGSVYSSKPYQDYQLHLEFRTPDRSQGRGPSDGNSGIYIHNLYEVQILNSYEDKAPAKHGCGSLYRVQAPLTNASRPRGEWQSYDILFRAAEVDDQGNVTRKARLSVRHNGIWIHDDLEVPGPTGSASKRPQVERAPFQLQNHGNAVRFRNIWIREVAFDDPPPAEQ